MREHNMEPRQLADTSTVREAGGCNLLHLFSHLIAYVHAYRDPG